MGDRISNQSKKPLCGLPHCCPGGKRIPDEEKAVAYQMSAETAFQELERRLDRSEIQFSSETISDLPVAKLRLVDGELPVSVRNVSLTVEDPRWHVCWPSWALDDQTNRALTYLLCQDMGKGEIPVTTKLTLKHLKIGVLTYVADWEGAEANALRPALVGDREAALRAVTSEAGYQSPSVHLTVPRVAEWVLSNRALSGSCELPLSDEEETVCRTLNREDRLAVRSLKIDEIVELLKNPDSLGKAYTVYAKVWYKVLCEEFGQRPRPIIPIRLTLKEAEAAADGQGVSSDDIDFGSVSGDELSSAQRKRAVESAEREEAEKRPRKEPEEAARSGSMSVASDSCVSMGEGTEMPVSTVLAELRRTQEDSDAESVSDMSGLGPTSLMTMAPMLSEKECAEFREAENAKLAELRKVVSELAPSETKEEGEQALQRFDAQIDANVSIIVRYHRLFRLNQLFTGGIQEQMDVLKRVLTANHASIEKDTRQMQGIVEEQGSVSEAEEKRKQYEIVVETVFLQQLSLSQQFGLVVDEADMRKQAEVTATTMCRGKPEPVAEVNPKGGLFKSLPTLYEESVDFNARLGAHGSHYLDASGSGNLSVSDRDFVGASPKRRKAPKLRASPLKSQKRSSSPSVESPSVPGPGPSSPITPSQEKVGADAEAEALKARARIAAGPPGGPESARSAKELAADEQAREEHAQALREGQGGLKPGTPPTPEKLRQARGEKETQEYVYKMEQADVRLAKDPVIFSMEYVEKEFPGKVSMNPLIRLARPVQANDRVPSRGTQYVIVDERYFVKCPPLPGHYKKYDGTSAYLRRQEDFGAVADGEAKILDRRMFRAFGAKVLLTECFLPLTSDGEICWNDSTKLRESIETYVASSDRLRFTVASGIAQSRSGDVTLFPAKEVQPYDTVITGQERFSFMEPPCYWDSGDVLSSIKVEGAFLQQFPVRLWAGQPAYARNMVDNAVVRWRSQTTFHLTELSSWGAVLLCLVCGFSGINNFKSRFNPDAFWSEFCQVLGMAFQQAKDSEQCVADRVGFFWVRAMMSQLSDTDVTRDLFLIGVYLVKWLRWGAGSIACLYPSITKEDPTPVRLLTHLSQDAFNALCAEIQGRCDVRNGIRFCREAFPLPGSEKRRAFLGYEIFDRAHLSVGNREERWANALKQGPIAYIAPDQELGGPKVPAEGDEPADAWASDSEVAKLRRTLWPDELKNKEPVKSPAEWLNDFVPARAIPLVPLSMKNSYIDQTPFLVPVAESDFQDPPGMAVWGETETPSELMAGNDKSRWLTLSNPLTKVSKDSRERRLVWDVQSNGRTRTNRSWKYTGELFAVRGWKPVYGGPRDIAKEFPDLLPGNSDDRQQAVPFERQSFDVKYWYGMYAPDELLSTCVSELSPFASAWGQFELLPFPFWETGLGDRYVWNHADHRYAKASLISHLCGILPSGIEKAMQQRLEDIEERESSAPKGYIWYTVLHGGFASRREGWFQRTCLIWQYANLDSVKRTSQVGKLNFPQIVPIILGNSTVRQSMPASECWPTDKLKECIGANEECSEIPVDRIVWASCEASRLGEQFTKGSSEESVAAFTEYGTMLDNVYYWYLMPQPDRPPDSWELASHCLQYKLGDYVSEIADLTIVQIIDREYPVMTHKVGETDEEVKEHSKKFPNSWEGTRKRDTLKWLAMIKMCSTTVRTLRNEHVRSYACPARGLSVEVIGHVRVFSDQLAMTIGLAGDFAPMCGYVYEASKAVCAALTKENGNHHCDSAAPTYGHVRHMTDTESQSVLRIAEAISENARGGSFVITLVEYWEPEPSVNETDLMPGRVTQGVMVRCRDVNGLMHDLNDLKETPLSYQDKLGVTERRNQTCEEVLLEFPDHKRQSGEAQALLTRGVNGPKNLAAWLCGDAFLLVPGFKHGFHNDGECALESLRTAPFDLQSDGQWGSKQRLLACYAKFGPFPSNTHLLSWDDTNPYGECTQFCAEPRGFPHKNGSRKNTCGLLTGGSAGAAGPSKVEKSRGYWEGTTSLFGQKEDMTRPRYGDRDYSSVSGTRMGRYSIGQKGKEQIYGHPEDLSVLGFLMPFNDHAVSEFVEGCDSGRQQRVANQLWCASWPAHKLDHLHGLMESKGWLTVKSPKDRTKRVVLNGHAACLMSAYDGNCVPGGEQALRGTPFRSEIPEEYRGLLTCDSSGIPHLHSEAARYEENSEVGYLMGGQVSSDMLTRSRATSDRGKLKCWESTAEGRAMPVDTGVWLGTLPSSMLDRQPDAALAEQGSLQERVGVSDGAGLPADPQMPE